MDTLIAKADSSIWADTVKRGDMQVMVPGLGVLATNKIAELAIPEELMKQVQPGQTASVDTGKVRHQWRGRAHRCGLGCARTGGRDADVATSRGRGGRDNLHA